MKRAFVGGAIILWAAGTVRARSVNLVSPDGKIQVTLSDDRGLYYGVEMDGKPVVKDSELGFELEGGKVLGVKARLGRETVRESNTTWEDPFGKRRVVQDHFRELRVPVEDEGVQYEVVVRTYNGGVALRYVIPKQVGMETFTITGERTTFAFAEDKRGWLGEPSVCAESRYLEHKLSEMPSKGTPGVVPLLGEIPQGYALVAESDLRNWAGMFLTGLEGRPGVKVSLARRKDNHGAVVVSEQRESPWRVIVLVRNAGELMESNLIKNLATPSQVADTSWIRPGITAWDEWWAKSVETRCETAGHERYIDLAATMGWPYQLVDWGWTKDGDTTKYTEKVNVPKLIAYAKSKNVRLFLWMHSNEVAQTGIEKSLANAAAWGAAGVKIDFMNSDSQETVAWYEEVLRTAAKHHLMVDFHGAYKPTGLARTWPNYITQEGVLGNEYNKLPGRKVSAEHTLMLAFTRGVLGPMDFTPGGFVNRTAGTFQEDAGAKEGGNCQVMGTRARQLAMTVVYESPLLCLCDSPESYLGSRLDQPQAGLAFFKGLPTVWEETKVLSAEIGDHVVVARRAGAKWYVGAMNGATKTSVKVPLVFLGEGAWTLRAFSDTTASAETPTEIGETTRELRAGETLTIEMAEGGGGFAGIITKK